MQWSLVALERLNHFVSIWRRHNVRDKRLRPQLVNAHLTRRRQRMSGGYHQRQLVQIHDQRFQLGLLRIVGQHADLDLVLQQIIGNVAAERAPDRDLDGGMQAAKFGENRQQVEHGKFVGGDGQFALLQLAHLNQGFLRILPQVDQFFRVFLQNAAGIGQHAVARGAVKQRLADLDLQFADGLADRRLRAKHLFRRAREAALPRYSEKNFELRDFHRLVTPRYAQNQDGRGIRRARL